MVEYITRYVIAPGDTVFIYSKINKYKRFKIFYGRDSSIMKSSFHCEIVKMLLIEKAEIKID